MRDSWRDSRLAVILFLLLLLCYTYTLPRWADPNQNSRLDMVIAVVEDGTFQIDEYVENTVDYAKVGEHYYSDKPPGAAFLGIPVYAGLKLFLDLPVMDGLMDRLANNEALQATLREEGSGLLEHKVRFAIAQVALTFVAAALPTAMMGALMYRLLTRFTAQPWPRIVVVLGYGLLTPHASLCLRRVVLRAPAQRGVSVHCVLLGLCREEAACDTHLVVCRVLAGL